MTSMAAMLILVAPAMWLLGDQALSHGPPASGRSMAFASPWVPSGIASTAAVAGTNMVASTNDLRANMLNLWALRTGNRATSTVPRAAGADAAAGVRVGVMTVPGVGGSEANFRELFEKLNVTNETYFQTEVPDALQTPLAAKFLAMSQTVDVIVVAHGDVQGTTATELLRAFQTVALTTNVAIVPCGAFADLAKIADIAVQMGEIRQQALLGGGARKSTFFGIGSSNSTEAPAKKQKVYF